MAVLKLRKHISKHTFNDTIDFWSNRPWKNPSVGKTSEREGVLLISSNSGNYISKNKTNSKYLSLPSFSVLEIFRKKPNSSNLEICAQTAVPYGLYGFFGKSCPDFNATVQQPYGLYGSLNTPL
jgi:hypothetical protein